MVENIVPVEFQLKLRKTTFDTNPVIIVKTHTFTGQKTTERLAKNLNNIGRIDSINTTMFSPYHLDLINNQNEVLFTSENKDFNNDFINLFIDRYQNYRNITNVNILFNISTFKAMRKNSYLICNFEKSYYKREEVQKLLTDLLDIVGVQPNTSRRLTGELFIKNIL